MRSNFSLKLSKKELELISANADLENFETVSEFIRWACLQGYSELQRLRNAIVTPSFKKK